MCPFGEILWHSAAIKVHVEKKKKKLLMQNDHGENGSKFLDDG